MDNVIDKALKRRNILLRELQELERFIATYRRLTGTDGEKSEPDHDVNTGYKIAPTTPTIRKRHGFPAQFARIIEGVLKDTDRPLNRAGLVSEIEKRGMEIPSQDKARYVGTIIWREREKFVHIVDHGYWLKYVPLPEIGYDPGDYGKEELAEAANVSIRRDKDIFS